MLTRRRLLQALIVGPLLPSQSVDFWIQPLEPYDELALSAIADAVEQVYRYHVRINDPIPVPEHARIPPRGSYLTRSIVGTLGSEFSLWLVPVLGVTCVDICQPYDHPDMGRIPDWGVMGAAELGGSRGIVSTARIKDRAWLPKIAVHEVGHIRGMPECDTPGCQMMDVRGVGKNYDTITYGWFCPKHYERERSLRE